VTGFANLKLAADRLSSTPQNHRQTVDVNAPLPPEKEPTEAEAKQYLQVLKDAMRLQMYFPQAKANSGLAVFHELAKRNKSMAILSFLSVSR